MPQSSTQSRATRVLVAIVVAAIATSNGVPVAAQSLKGAPSNVDLIDLLKNPTTPPGEREPFPGLAKLPPLPVFPLETNPLTAQPIRLDPPPFAISFAIPSQGFLAVDPGTGEPYRPLEPPLNETDFIADRVAAVRLGKALFWDMQVGSDGVQACGSCHFHAGADNRVRNQLNPGVNAGDNTLQTKGKNETLTAADFPLHKLANPNIPGEPLLNPGNVVTDSNDVVSSMGVLFREFTDIETPGPGAFVPGSDPPVLKPDLGVAVPDPVGAAFQGVRRVEPRNTPTVFSAAFNHNNFWDGRARHEFNGGSPFGAADPFSHVFVDEPGGLEATRQIISLASVASLATGPALSNFEMSFDGRFWAKIGKKLLQEGVVPLANQRVDPFDSVLGPLSNQQMVAGRPGLSVSYSELIEQAFKPEFWMNATEHLESVDDPNDPFDGVALEIVSGAADPADTNQYTQKEANMSLFFGLAVQAYTQILTPDDSPFDRFHDANPNEFLGIVEDISPAPGVQVVGLTPRQLFGYDLFQGSNLSQQNPLFRTGNCNICHFGPELTENSVTLATGTVLADIVTGEDKVITGFMLEDALRHPAAGAIELDDLNFALDQDGIPSGHALLDRGIYNIGVRPVAEDLGRGGNDPFGFPLSHATLALRKAGFPVGQFSSFAPPVDPLPAHLDPYVSPLPVGDAFPNINQPLFLPDTVSPTPEIIVEPTGTFPTPNRVGRMGSFKVPHLKNVELTGPYFHNGGKLTLRQVIDFYSRGGDFPATNAEHRDPEIIDLHVNLDARFTDADKDALVDFMLALTDERAKFKRAPFDCPEIFVPVDGTAPDNTGGRAGLLADARFLRIPENGAEGLPNAIPNFLGVSSVQGDPGLDHFDREVSRFIMSFKANTALPGAGTVSNEDIVSMDPATNTFSLLFDGSDVGLSSATIDGLCLLPGGDYLLSFTSSRSIPGMVGGPGGSTTLDDSDIVRFTPTSSGAVTAGVFTFYFDGSDVGLSTDNEDIDSIALSPAGNLVLSITGGGAVNGLANIQDEDLIQFTAIDLGEATSGAFTLYFDGSDAGLSTTTAEDIDAAFIGSNGAIYLSTYGTFAVPGFSGAGRDILRFTPSSLGDVTTGAYDIFRRGAAMSLPSTAAIGGFFIQ